MHDYTIAYTDIFPLVEFKVADAPTKMVQDFATSSDDELVLDCEFSKEAIRERCRIELIARQLEGRL